MQNNNTFNFLRQMVQEHRLLWQIMNNYRSYAAASPERHGYWKNLERETETRVALLEKLINQQINRESL